MVGVWRTVTVFPGKCQEVMCAGLERLLVCVSFWNQRQGSSRIQTETSGSGINFWAGAVFCFMFKDYHQLCFITLRPYLILRFRTSLPFRVTQVLTEHWYVGFYSVRIKSSKTGGSAEPKWLDPVWLSPPKLLKRIVAEFKRNLLLSIIFPP